MTFKETLLLTIWMSGGCLIFFSCQKKEKAFSALPQKRETSAEQGQKLYQQYCLKCHGETGQGDGPLAYLVYPRPRDFTRGLFKLRSTGPGQMPTDTDLTQTLRRGMPGTAMPSFGFLPEEKIRPLAAYVKTLTQRCVEKNRCINYFQQRKAEPIEVPPVIPFSPDLIPIGRFVYQQLGCARCHGQTGEGNGPSAATLTDEWGYPIRPRDFTRGVFMGGDTPRDLYLRIMTGLSGTPMPAFDKNLQDMAREKSEWQKFIWGLVYYVKSLERPPQEEVQLEVVPPQKEILLQDHLLKVAHREGLLAESDPYDRVWNTLQGFDIPVTRLWQTGTQSESVVRLRALENGKKIAFLLEWKDPTPNDEAVKQEEFTDEAALQFSLTSVPGFPGMGNPGNPVNIWLWKAEEQKRLSGHFDPLRTAYPLMAADRFTPAFQALNSFSAREAGNRLAQDRGATSVTSFKAEGPGTLTVEAPSEQNVSGRGVWANGTWRVLFVRDLRSIHPKEAVDFTALQANHRIPVALAVWDGEKQDRNGQKMVSAWCFLELQNR